MRDIGPGETLGYAGESVGQIDACLVPTEVIRGAPYSLTTLFVSMWIWIALKVRQ